jgi:hypothetical protein
MSPCATVSLKSYGREYLNVQYVEPCLDEPYVMECSGVLNSFITVSCNMTQQNYYAIPRMILGPRSKIYPDCPTLVTRNLSFASTRKQNC